MSVAFIVREFIDKHEEREPIFIDDLQIDEKQKNARNCEFYKLECMGKIRKYHKGIYYKPKVTKFGELGINKDKLVEYKYLRGKDGEIEGYTTGPTLWYNLNITTQVPKNKWIVSNKVNHNKIDEDLYAKIMVPKMKVNYKLIKYFILLDVIEQYDKIQDKNIQKYNEFIINTISKYKASDLRILKRVSFEYTKFVRNVLGMYIELVYNNFYCQNKNNVYKFLNECNAKKYEFIKEDSNNSIDYVINDICNDLKAKAKYGKKFSYKAIDSDIKREWGLY